MKNQDGWDVVHSTVDSVEHTESGLTLGYDGWKFGVSNEELNGLEVNVGDPLTLFTSNLSIIRGITINGRQVRYTTKEQAVAEHQKFLTDLDAQREREYQENIWEWRTQMYLLPKPLKDRMLRFEAEGGKEFWKESGGYELYVMNAAAALIRWAQSSMPDFVPGQLMLIDYWKELDYKTQLEIVPDYGQDHSGWTFSSGIHFAKAVLNGEPV